ncbi:MAG TPA: hypothetical protein VGQ57_14135, partial [Polyangiaceae bacterium]|nr:hypothetical protein [Polyangiaceae bacterium]
ALVACAGAPQPHASGAGAGTLGTAPHEGINVPPDHHPPHGAPSLVVPERHGRPCGDLDCLAFDSPREAFEAALRGSPRVIAVGEAHAQKAVPGVESATRRFARDLLPALTPRVKGLVIELLAPDRHCEQHEEQAVAERTKPVTAPQADTNQSDFIALGFAAKQLGIRAEPLVPTCEELKNVLAAQGGDIAALLALIATITTRETFDFLDHQPPEHAIAIYGGLLHNDTNPTPGHADWSFGPRIAQYAGGSYVEIDLIVPELVRNEPPWTNLPWLQHLGIPAIGKETRLLRTAQSSYVLIFPKTATTEP